MTEMPIWNRMKVLIAEKELREKRKITYRVIAKETGVSTSTLVRYSKQNIDRIDIKTLDTLCEYFSCQPGDLLQWAPKYFIEGENVKIVSAVNTSPTIDK